MWACVRAGVREFVRACDTDGVLCLTCNLLLLDNQR